MKRVLSVGLVVILALAMGMEAPQTQARVAVPQPLMDGTAAGGEVAVIVGVGARFVPEGDLPGPAAVADQRASVAEAVDGTMARAAAVGVQVGDKFDRIPYFTARVNRAQLEALATTAGVASINEDGLRKPSLATSVPMVNAPPAWTAGHTGAGWTVAILDTGVESTHPFLGGRVTREACYSDSNGGRHRHVGVPRRRRLGDRPRHRRGLLGGDRRVRSRHARGRHRCRRQRSGRHQRRGAGRLADGGAGVHPLRRRGGLRRRQSLALHRRLRLGHHPRPRARARRGRPGQRQPDRRGEHEPGKRARRATPPATPTTPPPRPPSTTCARSASPRSSPRGTTASGAPSRPRRAFPRRSPSARRPRVSAPGRRCARPAPCPGSRPCRCSATTPRRSTFSPRVSTSTRRC